MVTTASQPPAAQVAFQRLLWVGPLAIVAAIVANVLIRTIAVTLLRPDPQFMALTPVPPILFSLIGVLGAVIVYAIIGRFSRRPVWLFKRVALVVLLISLAPDLLLLLPGAMPGATVGGVAALILMHLTAYLICVRLLTTLASK